MCGIDPTDESLDAAAQAGRLVTDEGRLVLVGVANLATAGLVYMGAGAMIQSLVAETDSALERARAAIDDARSVDVESVKGLPPRDLIGEAERLGATLLVVGTHGRSRPLGALLNSVATTAVHETSSSLLVARGTPDPATFPASIVCGVDGSEQAAAGASVARALAERFDAAPRFIVAESGKNVDVELARGCVGDGGLLEVTDAKPVDALVEASEAAELIVIGSRALQGARAVGSVSERVAHEAACSVLIVR